MNACRLLGPRVFRGLALIGLLVGIAGCASPPPAGEGGGAVSRARAQRDLGIDYLSTFKTAMAIRELRASLERDPSDPVTHLWLGEAYRR